MIKLFRGDTEIERVTTHIATEFEDDGKYIVKEAKFYKSYPHLNIMCTDVCEVLGVRWVGNPEIALIRHKKTGHIFMVFSRLLRTSKREKEVKK